jgi:hypothetical protein
MSIINLLLNAGPQAKETLLKGGDINTNYNSEVTFSKPCLLSQTKKSLAFPSAAVCVKLR